MSEYTISIVENPPKLAEHPHDTLFECYREGEAEPYFVRARAFQTTNESAFINAVASDVLNFKFQCSLAVDATGDVMLDSAGNHCLLSAEVHGVVLGVLEDGTHSLDVWVAERLEAQTRLSLKKAYFLRHVAPKYRA